MNTIGQAKKLSNTLKMHPTVGLEADAANTIDALLAELAALKAQKPVAWALPEITQQHNGQIVKHTAFHGYSVPLYLAAGAQPYDQQAMELCEACGWKAIIPGEPCLVCERNDALAAGAQPVSHDSIEFRQFLSDVLTAAGLLEHGKQSKGLAERIAYGAVRYMAAPVQAGAQPVQQEQMCPYCGGSGDITSLDGEWRGKCVCEAGTPAAAAQAVPQQFGNESHFRTRQERAKPVQREPLFWYRPCSDGGYEGPISNGSIEDVRKRSGAWIPLVAAPVQAGAQAQAQERKPKCVARIEVFGKDWRLDYLSLPVGKHDLYAQEYTHDAQERKPLTDEQIYSITGVADRDEMMHRMARNIARAIEQAHGIKEQP